MIYLLTAFGLSPGGSTHLHTNSTKNNTNNNRTTQHVMWKSAGRAPSLRVLPWHLPYNWGKSTEKPVWVRKTSVRLRKTAQCSIHITRTPTHYKTITNTHTLQTPPHTHTHAHTHARTHTRTRARTHAHAHTHTHTHTHTKQYKTTIVQIKTKSM